MPEIMRSKSQALLGDLQKPAAVRIFLHIMICCQLLEVRSNGKRFIFSAAPHAQRAVACLHGLQSARLFVRAFHAVCRKARGRANEIGLRPKY